MMTFFDGDCVVGRRQVLQPGTYWETPTLLMRMGEYGIEKALASHSMAREFSAEEGNAFLSREIEGTAKLEGKWAVMPHHTGEFPKPDALRTAMKANRIRSVVMYPTDHNFSLEPWCCGDLLAMLEACKVPVFLEAWQAPWGVLHTVLSTYPGLRVVMTHLHYSYLRNLYPLLEQHENLALETFGFKNFNGIEDVCRRFGAARLIFGTGTPVYSATAAIGMIMYADISPEEKRLIARGNLVKLLGEVSL